MDEYLYPITVEGEWRPEQAKSVKNKLQIYFQSKKKSQGGDCVVQYDGSNSARVLFKSPDLRDGVLSKEGHIIAIDNQKIELKVYKPSDEEEQPDSTGQRTEQACGYHEPNQSASQTDVDVNNPQGSGAVVLENLPDGIKKDVLTLLVENISSVPENEFSLELIPEIQKTIVTFKNPSAADKFLEDSRTHEKSKQYNLRSCSLERSTCVRVEGLPVEASNNKMLLELYFEKWGGPVEEVITIPAEQAAIIIFKEEEAKERVLKQENNICEVPVKIYPYFKSLDTILYGGIRPHRKLPEPFTVSVHPHIREFILKKGQMSSIKDQMSSHFCEINMDKPEVLLSPDPALLKQKQEAIDDWSRNVFDGFKKMISNYSTAEWPVSHPVSVNVETSIKLVVKDQVFIDLDASKGVLTLAGMTHEIIGLKPIIEKFLERGTNQIEREKNSVTEYMEISPALYSLLEQDGLKSAVSPHLLIDYNKELNRLFFSGLHTETLTFKYWVLEKKINMKRKQLQTNLSIIKFLRSVDCDEMSRDLFISRGITAVYTIENGDVVVIGSTERALKEAEKRVNTVLTTKDLTVEDQGVLEKAEWQDLKKRLGNLFCTPKKISVLINLSKKRDKVTVTGFREAVVEVSENLGSFIEKHTRIFENIHVKSHAVVDFIKDRKSRDWQDFINSNEVKVSFDSVRPWIKLSGERTFVQPAVTLFKKLADDLYTDTLIIKKAGAKKYFMEQGKIMLSMLLKEKRCVVVPQENEFTQASFKDCGQVSCEVRIPGGVTVTVRKANICKINVDAVVNAANEDLKHIGGLALALLQAAGPSLQQTCDQHIQANGPLKPGDAIITDAGRLPCKYVVHAVGTRFSDSDRRNTEQRLRRAVRESLKLASSKNCSSIAFPVFSSGIFGCPLDLCTELIAKEVCEYIEHHNYIGFSSTVTEIQFVDNNGGTVNAMTQAVRQEFAAYNPRCYANYGQGYRGAGRGYGRSHSRSRGHGRGYGRGCGRGHYGRGYYGQSNQEFKGFKGRGNGDFERQPHFKRDSSNSGGRPDISERLSVLEITTTQDGLKVILSKGNIQDAHADVIVNTISEELDLSKGAVSTALLQTAGHQLQSEITRTARLNNVNYGEMIITNGYNLKCQKVFHVVCPLWKGSEDEVIVQMIRDCLIKAERWRMASVVFPPIGTGNLGFPKDLVAKIMMTEILNFKSTNLQKVTVIVHPSDRESVECFTSILRHGIQGPIMTEKNNSGKSSHTSEFVGKVSSPSLGVHTMKLGQVILEVSSGDITKEKTDAIVNSSNQTFSLKAGVSKAILGAAGVQVEQECSQIVKSSKKQQTEIVTSAGQLPCGNIIHVIGRNSPSEIKDVVLSVLKLCEARQITSVAFPALGTGQGGAKPADVADAMVDAVANFIKTKKPVHVRLVKYLIFQTNMMSDFHQSMIRRSGEKVEEDKGLLTSFKGESSEFLQNEEFVIVGEDIEPAVFQLCGETPEDLSEAKDMINSMILREHVIIPIYDPAIAHFTREDGDTLNAMQRELTVSVRLEKKGQDSVITLEGLTKDVHTAESRIRDMIRKVERNETRRSEAFIIKNVVSWEYQEDVSKGRVKTFDIFTNFVLEQAYQKRQSTVKIKINNDEYEADLVLKEATRGRLRIPLNRVELED